MEKLQDIVQVDVIFLFTSRSRIFHLYEYGDVTITGEGLQNLGLCSALRALELGGPRGLYRATPAVTRDLGRYDTQGDVKDLF
jgi:hypothetical protein